MKQPKHVVYRNDEESDDPTLSSENQLLSIEDAMEVVGQRHRYQVYVTIISLLVWLITTYGYMVIPYYLSAPEFECQKDGEWQVCNESTGACDSSITVRMLTQLDSTISADFSLFCEHRNARVMIEALPLLGAFIGTFFFVFISDRFGRRRSIQFCWLTGIITSLILNFASSRFTLILGSFGVGFSALILQSLVVVHVNELSIGQFRVMALIGMYVFWSLSEMQYVWMMALIPSWKWNMFAFYTLPVMLLMIPTTCLIHDSPRYLYIKSRAKCLESLDRIAAFNKRASVSDKQLEVYKGDFTKQYTYLDLITYRSQRMNTIILSFVFFFVNMVYQGTQVELNSIGSSFGENSFYVGIGELLGFGVSDAIAHRIPRKKGIFLSFGATCVLLVSFHFFELPQSCAVDLEAGCWQKTFQEFLLALARSISSITFGLQLLLCGEIYPNTLKSLGLGLSIAVGFLGTMFSPFIVDFAKDIGIHPIVLIGIIGLVGNTATLFSAETLGVTAPIDIPEIQEEQRKDSPEEDLDQKKAEDWQLDLQELARNKKIDHIQLIQDNVTV